MAKPVRFFIRTEAGDEPCPRAETAGSVLSKAITRAERALEPCSLEVVEYDDVLYRVHAYGRKALVSTAVERVR